jgi:4-diphosphocytidyl-2-C-methyl-D-erythritol kinase
MTNPLRTRAPAKVNLTLHILGVRPDGYHELNSLVAFTGWGDNVTFAPRASKNGAFTLSIEGPFGSSLKESLDNLVLKAAIGFSARFPQAVGGHFTLLKNIPVAAGVGGGSSDGAAALRLLGHVYGVTMTHPDLLELARGLGADVPVCLRPQLQRMEGIGERLTPLEKRLILYAVLINPRVPLSTASVFRSFDSVQNPSSSGMSSEKANGDLMASVLEGENSLESVAQVLCPEVTAALELLRVCDGCILARMSGSGPTVWGLFPNRQRVMKAVKFLKKTRPEWWIRPCLLR